ncbi:Cation/H(+) antiporter 15 [Linum grandiflorum]
MENDTTSGNYSTMSLKQNGGLTVEGMSSGVVNLCHTEVVPVNLNNSVFWKLAKPKNVDDPSFVYYVPYYFIQLTLILFAIHLFALILKPLRLPRFSVELLAGVVVGPSVLGLRPWYSIYILPPSSLKVLDTLGHLSLIYYVFLVGLEIDLSTIRHVGKQAVYTGLTGAILPLFIGLIQFFIMAADPEYPDFFTSEYWQHLVNVRLTGAVFWGVALTVTSFPDLARILSDIKLLHTDIGRLALSASIVSELTSWILLVVGLTLTNGTLNPLFLLPTLTFFAGSWFVVRPAVTWLLRHADEADNTVLLNFVVFGGIMTSSIITDACGANSMIGAFVFGLVMPNGEVAVKIMEKLEDYVKGVMIPAFFLVNGVRTSLPALFNADYGKPVYVVFPLIAMAWSAKIAGTFVFSKLAGMSARESLTLGVLMNTKGVLALIVINTGRNIQGFNHPMFAVLVLSILLMSVTVIPLAKALNKSNRRSSQFKHRTVESNKLESELRILTCIHSPRNLSGMINLLESSNASKQYPICVFALHLVQLTERRATAMLIVHDSSASNRSSLFDGGSSGQNLSRREEDSKHIITAFESLESRGPSVSAQSLTVVSPYTTMHEDVSCLGEDKRVTLILVPFHKQADVYGRLQDENLNWRTVNKNLMATATCSVGILVDRGLGSNKDRSTVQSVSQPQSQQSILNFAVIFIGGPDDREALAYGWRMAKSPTVNFTVLRLISDHEDDQEDEDDDQAEEVASIKGSEQGGGANSKTTVPTVPMRSKKEEREIDDEYMNEFRFRTMHDESINYVEKVVKTGDEVVGAIGRAAPGCDLYILGQRKDAASSVMLGLSEWTECEELGVLGDTLLASEFAEHSSLLVIKQHYVPGMRVRVYQGGSNSQTNSRVMLANAHMSNVGGGGGDHVPASTRASMSSWQQSNPKSPAYGSSPVI